MNDNSQADAERVRLVPTRPLGENEGSHEVPHFHAEHGEDQASVAFDGTILAGMLTARSARFVREWALLHQAELEHNWDLARARQPLDRIDPLA